MSRVCKNIYVFTALYRGYRSYATAEDLFWEAALVWCNGQTRHITKIRRMIERYV